MDDNRLSTGIAGLDRVLDGGFIPGRSYMLRGPAGGGKTIFGMEYLTAGDGGGLFVSFEESGTSLRTNADSIGIDISDVSILDLSPDSDFFTQDQSYDVFATDEVEGEDVTDKITDAVDDRSPERVFVDPLTHLRQFSPDDYQFRKEVASFMRYLSDANATTLFSTQPTGSAPDEDLQFLSDGAIELERSAKGRTVEVTKFRGSDFQSGKHTMRIREGGIDVYPQLQPGSHRRTFDAETVSSGVPELDALLGGGIERGTVTVVSGPSGVGKTTTGTHFMNEAASRGERSVIYMFEEDTATFRHRSEAVGVPVSEMEAEGALAIEEVEPLAVSPDEFADMVRTEVEQNDAQTVMIDGTAGYQISLQGEDEELTRELHALCRYLRNMGVTVLLIEEVPTVTGEFRPTGENISYLADNILFLRYLELEGKIGKATGVLKKRTSDFERTLREFRIDTEEGLVLGDPLTGLRGVLTGAPELANDD